MVPVPNWEAAFKYGRRQLGKIEEIVVDCFLRDNGDFYDAYGFNVPVWVNPSENRAVLRRSKPRSCSPEPYRIDIVARFGTECELIEVKETGNMTAIGQLLTYRMLFQRNFWGYTKLHLRLVAVKCPEAIRISCLEQGINISEVGEQVADLVKQVRSKKSSIELSPESVPLY